ncbi:hypothetical protein [Paraburkholderia bryophila]|uniref:Uncharacterized protein n=1 Tax=Paraburkholderia bryophila TaxID=420952 RepID=A0A329CFX8_9BURK|nr:hypothetical protein [Paraburkholderia bryophila]RAS33258.1 hypothetical protein BX591_107175 [Paraburkholderia bryophila]
MHGNGGTGSPEHTQAIAFNGGVQRRNSITQAHEIHALQPTGAATHVTRAQLEGVRHGGSIDASALMGLLHPSTEIPWKPHVGGGRDQIRTGRNFSVPDSGGGANFDIRVHTRDDKQARKDAAKGTTSNAGMGSVIRVEQGKKVMLSKEAVSSDSRVGTFNWSALKADTPLRDSAHIPAVLPPVPTPPTSTAMASIAASSVSSSSSGSTHAMPPVATPPRSRAWDAMGQITSMAGTALWHGSGASSIVGGTRQFARNMQPGGTWTGAGIGAVRAVAGAAVMTSLATSMPVRAAASAGMAGLSAMAGMLGGKR